MFWCVCVCESQLFCILRHGLTTYKELCSLASDLNQPDLVYKFMNLANHHAMWNSRKVGLCLECTKGVLIRNDHKASIFRFHYGVPTEVSDISLGESL